MKFIFEIHIKPGHTLEEYVQAWKQGSAIIQRQPGARGTSLFRKCDSVNVLLAIADWTSKAHRDQAMEALRHEPEEVQQTVSRHLQFGDFIKIGEFDETEWHVVGGVDVA